MDNVCKKLCNECPFSKNSAPGFLPGYNVTDFQNMMQRDIFFPCHMMMPDRDLTMEETSRLVKMGQMKMCRGYLESMIKSCVMPRDPLLARMRNEVKTEGISENSMSTHEFFKHHNQFKP